MGNFANEFRCGVKTNNMFSKVSAINEMTICFCELYVNRYSNEAYFFFHVKKLLQMVIQTTETQKVQEDLPVQGKWK